MNRDPRGFYAALQVTPDATPAEIQRSFRALMRRHHPDLDASSGAARDASGAARDVSVPVTDAEEVGRILESFAVLRNPQSRAVYDPAFAPRRPGPTQSVGRDIPVRLHHGRQPVLRVTPVRWERGPE
jgi:DnaJ-class molecular chaperone